MKRNRCILEMKELFGEGNMFEYIRFFDEHCELAQEEVIAKYIGSLDEREREKEKKDGKFQDYFRTLKEIFGEGSEDKYRVFYLNNKHLGKTEFIEKYILDNP